MVPTFTVILVGIMVVYIAFVWLMYKRIMPLSAATSAAQNKLSGVLSDAVTNILAVKTCGREDFERDLFDTADRAARDAETVSMHDVYKRQEWAPHLNTASEDLTAKLFTLVEVILGVVPVVVIGLFLASKDATSVDKLTDVFSPVSYTHLISTIVSLVRTEPDKARSLLIDFSNYYRQTLSDSDTLTTLEHEVEQGTRYINQMCIRDRC